MFLALGDNEICIQWIRWNMAFGIWEWWTLIVVRLALQKSREDWDIENLRFVEAGRYHKNGVWDARSGGLP